MGTVVIGCKLPHGLHMELRREVAQDKVTMQLPDPDQRVTLNGPNGDGVVTHHGYGLTVVDDSFWKTWLGQNQNLPFVVKGLIFEAKNENEAKAQAKEGALVLTGLEQINQTATTAQPGVISKDDGK